MVSMVREHFAGRAQVSSFADAQRLSSGAFEAVPVLAAATVGSGPNVACNDLLDVIWQQMMSEFNWV